MGTELISALDIDCSLGMLLSAGAEKNDAHFEKAGDGIVRVTINAEFNAWAALKA
jgi:hypothetical protein